MTLPSNMLTLPEHGAQTSTPAKCLPATTTGFRGPGTLVMTAVPLAENVSITSAATASASSRSRSGSYESRHRLALAGAPVAHLAERLGQLVGASCSSGAATRSVRVPRCSAAKRLNASAMPLTASQSLLASHGGAIAALNWCTNGVKVGARQVVLGADGSAPGCATSRSLVASRRPKGLRAQVPVNVVREDKAHALGNELTSLFVDLPVTEPDPMARYRRVVERAEELKAGMQRVGGKTIVDLADMGPLTGRRASRPVDVRRHADVQPTITNVPGPQ